MSEEIVTCPGCAKKFRLPEGAQSGSFPCTACNANVPYGATAKAGARGPARPAPAMTRPAPAQAAPRQAARPSAVASAPSREASPRHAPSSRRTSRHDDAPEPKKGNPALVWGGVGLGVAVIVIAYIATRPAPKAADTAQQPAKTPAVTAKAPEAVKPDPVKPAVPDPVKSPPVASDPPRPAPPPANTGPDVKIPVGDAVRPPDIAVAADNRAVLGQKVASVKGMTDEERSDMDRAVALAMDMDSGKDGANAEGKLLRSGKKAMPSILTAFSMQFTNGKWATTKDQWGADRLQDLLHRITGADCPREGDFWPKFDPQNLTPPEDFEKACKNWLNWWNMAGAMKEKYKQRND